MKKATFGQFAIHEPVQNFAGGGETVRVDVYGAIGWEVWADEFLSNLRQLPESVTDIDLRVHSYGGSVLDGWAIANALRQHKASVTATVEGTAASMASVIAMSANKVIMPKNAYLMIHRVASVGMGTADDIENAGRTARQLESDIVDFYAEKTGIASEEIREMMAAETWMNGEEAVEKGFAHEVIAEVAAAAYVGERNVFENFGQVPAAVMEANSLEVGGKLEVGSQQSAVAEGQVVDDESGEGGENAEAPEWDGAEEEEEVDATSGVLAFVKNLMGRDRDGGASGVAALTAERDRLIAQVESLTADRDSAVMERDQAREKLSKLERDAREVQAVIAECGFSHAEAVDLPAPEDEAEQTTDGSVLEQFEAMEPGPARREFFRAHKDEILALSGRVSPV